MTTIDAAYRLVTPLFCAGVDPNRPELRLPSFKGVLRFWWRALAWSRCDGDLSAIQQQEDRLFGSAGGGQSRVLMRLDCPSEPETVAKDAELKASGSSTRTVGDGARYLGYGLMDAFPSKKKGRRAGQLHRACCRPPFDFAVHMRGRGLDESELATLKDALIALGTLGGMGARSRKGYGSLVLRSLQVDGNEHWRAPTSAAELSKSIAALRHRGGGALPEFTALSGGARHVLVSGDGDNPVELLDLVGREIVRFRSWGRNEMILGGSVKSEQHFTHDHDLMKMDRGRTAHPRRIAFGLPHNYGKRDADQVGPWDKDLDRRASPLFIHLHECTDGPVAVLSFLPARFLPAGRSDISVGADRVPQAPETELFGPVCEFLDRLLDPRQRKESFSNVIEVPS